MKRWRSIVVVLLILAGAIYVYLHWQEWGLFGSRTAESGETSNSSESVFSSLFTHPTRPTWASIDRSPDGFKVDMPSTVQEAQIAAYNEKGGAEQVEMIYSNPDASTTYAVTWADNPPVTRTQERSPDRILDLARDDALLRTQTTLNSESHPNPDGYPARDFTAHNAGGGVMSCRLIYTGQRLYMMTAAFPSARARNEQDVMRFFNSFAFTESPRIPATLPAARRN